MHNPIKEATDKGFGHDLKLALNDLISSFAVWRIFGLIGVNDIRKRYARSRLGQFWLTLSVAINVSALGLVWAYLFKMPVKEYMPFLAAGTIFWTYISSCIIEGANLYIASTAYLKELNIPKLSYINGLFVKNIIVLFHNLLVLGPVFLFCGVGVNVQSILLSAAGFILTSIFLFGSITIIAILSLRFRDFPNIITSLLQIVFYLTPVMWKVELMPERVHKYMVLNPFCVFLSICREPLLERPIPDEYWLAAIIYTLLSLIIAFPFFSKFRTRIIYWA